MRYVNVKATDVATLMHGEALDVRNAAAGYQMSVSEALDASFSSSAQKNRKAVAKRQASKPHSAIESVLVSTNELTAGISPAQNVRAHASKQNQGQDDNNVIAVDFKRRAA